MREAAPAKISSLPIDGASRTTKKCRVRSSPGGYFSGLFFFSFVAGFAAHLGYGWTGLILLVGTWAIVPVLIWFDRIEFDGKYLTRKGVTAFLARLLGSPTRIKLADIEQIETNTLRTLRTGGRIYLRYRCEIFGDGLSFVFASGGKNFRQMIRNLLPLVSEEKLDLLSLEMRDFLVELGELERKTAELKLPSTDVLEDTLPLLRRAKSRQAVVNAEEIVENDSKSAELRQAANELRVAGNLSQAIEAFRRALRLQPENAALLHEFARGLHSFAAATRNSKLLRRVTAALRLAARRGDGDANLLTRIGETCFNFGATDAAAKIFRRVLELDSDNFRAECGLAEIGLTEGKLAHVVHHYQSAARAAADEAAKKWARREAEYFSELNRDADYMDVEISRIGWLNSTVSGRRICLRLTVIGLLIVLAGLYFGADVSAVGWAVSAATLAIWALLSIAEIFLAGRFPAFEDDEDEN